MSPEWPLQPFFIAFYKSAEASYFYFELSFFGSFCHASKDSPKKLFCTMYDGDNVMNGFVPSKR